MKPTDIRALVSTNDPIFARLIKVLLEAAGVTDVEVSVSGDQQTGSQPERDKQPVIVFAEWNTDTRHQEPAPNVPVANDNNVPVVLLGHEHSLTVVNDARDAGAAGYISAPVNLRSIQAWIAGMVEGCDDVIEVPGYLGPERRREFAAVPAHIERRLEALRAS
jgi:AmiR/NasT family two-component response regulator